MTAADDTRAAIAAALDPVLAEWVRDGTAAVSPHPVPGLPPEAVWRVHAEDADHPMQAYVGRWPDGTARVLTDDQPAFHELVAAVGAEIGDPETAVGYVLAFLEVTRGAMVLVRPIADASEIRWRPGTPDEEARREAFLAEAAVAPPTAEANGDGFRVQAWLVVDQRIQVNRFEVGADGAIAASFKVVAEDLPLPIAR